MDKLKIEGGRRLNGTVHAGGAKNAALPILFATLLTKEKSDVKRVPDLHDIESTATLLKELGANVAHVKGNQGEMTVDAKNVGSIEAPYDIVRKMRASVLVLGPLLARFGEAKVSLPGGCAIGARPIDLHLKGMEKLGAEIKLEEGYVLAKSSRLKGADIHLDFPSVGATENILMAATLADGTTTMTNCALEPEIADLARALRSMGAKISGEGTSTIKIEGVKSLHGMKHSVIGDRIEAGTYLAAALMTNGSVTVEGINPDFLEATLAQFVKMGAGVTRMKDGVSIQGVGRPRAADLTTLPFPGFPTDMQAQIFAVASIAEGTSTITETIFENRFMHAAELTRLGADIRLEGNKAFVTGVAKLKAAPVMATDLRASASLVLAGLAAEGTTVVSRIYHLDRGYERMEEKLAALGAEITRERE